MKQPGALMVALLHAMAVIIVFVFTFASASAHTPNEPDGQTVSGTAFVKDSHKSKCTAIADAGQRLHCHLTLTKAEAAGQMRVLKDDHPALVTLSANPPARSTEADSALVVNNILIAGPPLFILFGNFRS